MKKAQNNITQAVILSAGLGTRVRHISDTIPKVMAPIQGKPLLLHHIERLKRHGVRKFFINLHHKPDAIRGYFGDGSSFGVSITYAEEQPKTFGTAGGIKNFEAFLDDAFFVIYGDMFSAIDYGRMADTFFTKPEAIGMVAVGINDHPQDSDLVEVDDHLRIARIHRKPHETLPKAWRTLDAVYIFRKKILSYIPPVGTYYEIDHQLLPEVIAKGERFYGYEYKEFLLDIGTPERYYQVNKYLEGGGEIVF